MLRKTSATVLLVVILLAVVAGGCKPGAATTATEPTSPAPADTSPPTDTPIPPTPTPIPPTPTPELPPESGLPANPQRVEFQAQDGTQLVGYYYPSRFADAPVVVLAHWAGGDQRDWVEIALWLQNRRDEVTDYPQPGENNIEGPWLDPSWFPPMPADVSLAVFTFDFRGYGESSPGNWEDAQDAQAAFETAATMEGVDPQRMAGVGASIGADGAPDGCLLYNQAHGEGCLGAISLSPGSYLGIPFDQAVEQLEEGPPPAEVWCLATEEDEVALSTCQSASGDLYQIYTYEGMLHGMFLLSPELEPQPMELIQQFLGKLFGIESMGP